LNNQKNPKTNFWPKKIKALAAVSDFFKSHKILKRSNYQNISQPCLGPNKRLSGNLASWDENQIWQTFFFQKHETI
jgi:hypothetical protein